MDKSLKHARLSKLSISVIRTQVKEAEPEQWLIDKLAGDSRAGVRSLAQSLERRREKTAMLLRRQKELFTIERGLYDDGFTAIAGLDEAGRGPLAGPVVAAAVILPPDSVFPGLDDSKKLSAAKREKLFTAITAQATAWGIGMAEHDEIDDIGILEAAMGSMRIAVENMGVIPDVTLIDGNRSPHLDYPERMIVSGDSRCRVIAAASIIAKVTRDRMMIAMDRSFPGYGFSGHKGYGCASHAESIRRQGPCSIHRLSFKLVPESAPTGTCAELFKQRLHNAPTRNLLERAASGIARCSEHLSESELDMLRIIYRDCRRQFDGATV